MRLRLSAREGVCRPCVPTSLGARGAAQALSRAPGGREKSLGVPDGVGAEPQLSLATSGCGPRSEVTEGSLRQVACPQSR